MSLESAIADLIVALNANTAAHTGGVVPASTATEEPKKTRGKKTEITPTEVVAPVVPTVDDLRAAINECIKVGTEHGEDANSGVAATLVAAINKRHGTKKLTEMTEDKRAGVIAEFKAATALLNAQPAASSAI